MSDLTTKVFQYTTLFIVLVVELVTYVYEKLTTKQNYKERDISGAVAIVTGANSGIGKTTAFELARRGATVVLACRNITEGKKVMNEMHQKQILGDKGKLDLIELDLADTASIRRFAATVKSKYPKIDILVNNAGVFDTSGVWRKTVDDFEMHFGVNHLGHFLLTNLLLDEIKRADSARVITIASSLQILAMPYMDMGDLMLLKKDRDWSFFNALPYGLSKFSNSLFAKALNRRLQGTNAVSYSLCPGYVETGLFRSSSWIKRVLVNMTVKILGLSSEEGCYTTTYLAVCKDRPEGGKFYRFNKVHSRITSRLKDSLAEDMWAASSKLVQLK